MAQRLLGIFGHKFRQGCKKIFSRGFFFLFLKNLFAVRTMANLVNFGVGGSADKVSVYGMKG